MRISDWSSEVCSSDLADILRDVNLGRIKAGFGDKPILAYQLSQGKYPDVRLVESYESVVAGPVGIGVRHEDDALLNKRSEKSGDGKRGVRCGHSRCCSLHQKKTTDI